MGLAAGYVVFAAVMFGFGSRQSTWLACLSAAVDVTAVTTFVFLVGATRLPLWILYVFPLATAGAAGLIPALVGGGLVLGDGAIVVSSSQQTVRPADLWPLAVLGAAAILVAVLPSFWLVEWREKRAREEITWLREMGRRERVLGKAANQMLGPFEAGQVRAAAIAAAADGLDLSVAVIDRDDVQRASEEESMAPVGDTRTALAMGQEAALTVSAEDGPAARHGQRWLERLSEVTDIALQRCAEHEALQAEEQRLRAIWERLPAPAALWGPGGDMLPANGAYRDLGLVAHPTMNEPGEDLTIGEPARTSLL